MRIKSVSLRNIPVAIEGHQMFFDMEGVAEVSDEVGHMLVNLQHGHLAGNFSFAEAVAPVVEPVVAVAPEVVEEAPVVEEAVVEEDPTPAPKKKGKKSAE